jgi:hypothetical protein
VDAIPGQRRSQQPKIGHVILEVAVENSWPCMTGGPSGRDDLSKSRRDLLRGPAKHAVTCGASGSPPRDEEIRAADQDGAARQRGSDREGSSPAHWSVADIKTLSRLRSGLRPKGKEAAGARLIIFASTATSGGIIVELVASARIDADTCRRRGAAMLALVRMLTNLRPVVIAIGQKSSRSSLCVRLDTAPLDLAGTSQK